MAYRLFCLMALGLLSGVTLVSAQPGPMSTAKNSSLIFPASTLLTNGLPGLAGPPVTLMVSTVQSNSTYGGAASLAGSQTWVRRYNGALNDEDQAQAIAVDKDGNVIVAGYSHEGFTSADFLTIKYTPDGIGLWTNHYDGPDHGLDRISSVAVDDSGGVYVSGESASGITTIKYSSDGTPVWINSYTNSSGDLFFGGLAADGNGNAYLLPVDITTDSYITVKYDAAGHAAWTNFFKSSATSTESASDVAVDAAGNIFVTGFSFDSTSGTAALTIKYASSGAALWTNRYSLGGSASGNRVIVDPHGDVIVAGDTQGGTGQHKYVLVKYSNSGTQIWTNIIAAADYVGGGVPQITTDPAGNVFLVGATPGAGSTTIDYTSLKFSSTGLPLWTNRFVDPNGGTAALFGAGTDNAGNLYWSTESASPNGTNYNYVTLKYATNGTPVWTNRYNGPANASDLPRAMTVDKAGGVYVTGTSSTAGSSFSALDWATVKYADNIRYIPPANFVGQDTVTFTAFDSFGNSALGTLIINVLSGPTSVVAPDDYTSVAGNAVLNTLVRSTNMPRTYQMQFTPDAMGGLPVGARITALAFRLSTNTVEAFPPTATAWSDYEVTLAQAANPIASMSTTFQANLLNPVLVKDGPLSIGANNFSAGGNPNSFAALMVLDTPYIYQGGDLVMQFAHPGSDSTNNAFLDAANSSSPGYGTSFRAISANAFPSTTGIAASVTIVAIVFTPTVTQTITRTANQFTISGGGGLIGSTYQILTATNITLPVDQWTPIATNQFGASGSFNYTNVIQPNAPAQYFRVMLP